MKSLLTLLVAAGITAAIAPAVGTAFAQSTPSNNWNGNWSFSSTSQANIRLMQADMVEKKRNDYWETAGRTVIYSTTVIGAYNQTEINQNLSNVTLGDGATISNESWADNSNSCQNGSINIATGGGSTASGC